MRPIYETPEQRATEKAMAERVSAAWSCGLIRRPELDRVDWVLTARGGRLTRAFMECKDRHYTWEALERFGGVYCSEQKWLAARGLYNETDVPFVFVVRVLPTGALWYHRTIDFAHDGIDVKGGRTDRNDPRDIERCVKLRQSRFALVESSAPVDTPTFMDSEINWSFS